MACAVGIPHSLRGTTTRSACWRSGGKATSARAPLAFTSSGSVDSARTAGRMISSKTCSSHTRAQERSAMPTWGRADMVTWPPSRSIWLFKRSTPGQAHSADWVDRFRHGGRHRRPGSCRAFSPHIAPIEGHIAGWRPGPFSGISRWPRSSWASSSHGARASRQLDHSTSTPLSIASRRDSQEGP